MVGRRRVRAGHARRGAGRREERRPLLPERTDSLTQSLRRFAPSLLAAAALAIAFAAVAPSRAQARDPVVAAAGDVACDPTDPDLDLGAGDATHCRHRATSDLILRGGFDSVLMLGDTQYRDGLFWKYAKSYGPTWGRFKGKTHPVIGNHDYFDGTGAGYFDYFDGLGNATGAAGTRGQGWYSFDIGAWHVVALNSLCSRVGGCGPGSPQEQWLRADLAAHPAQCTLAFWHHPRYTASGEGWPSLAAIWRALYHGGADVILNGHAHQYERFAPRDAEGGGDPGHGLRQFVVGTGGKSLGGIEDIERRSPFSQSLNYTTFGVLSLALHPGSYDWRFLPIPGSRFSDSGSTACHGPPPPRRPGVTTGPATLVDGSAATLQGAVDPREAPTTYRFEYGPTTAYGKTSASAPVGAPTGGPQDSATRVTGLAPGATYHYRVVATSSAGTAAGADRAFVAHGASRYADMVAATPGLLAYWRLGDRTGGFAFDVLGHSLGTTTGQVRPRAAGVVNGDPDGAADFDKSFVTSYAPVVSANATLEGWFRWRDGLVPLRDDSSTGGWYIARPATRGRLSYRVAGKTFRTARPVDSVRDGAWHQIAVTKAGPNVAMYVDGRLVSGAGGAPDVPATSPWHLMRNGPLDGFATGAADEVAIYDRALTPAELLRHYEVAVAGAAPDTRVSGPDLTNDSSPTFRLASTQRGSRLRCGIAPTGAIPSVTQCARDASFPDLADGAYTVSAYAVDRRGYPDPTPAQLTFTLDTVAPRLTLLPRRATRSGLLGAGLDAHVTCSEDCRVRGFLSIAGRAARRAGLSRGRRVTIGRGSVVTPAGVDAVLHLDLTRRARKHLRQRRFPVVLLRAGARDAAGNRLVVQRRLRVHG